MGSWLARWPVRYVPPLFSCLSSRPPLTVRDCPCLGGMADGPCGEEFKQAFSCFVYSEAEPKGIDCVEKFRGMQECFRKYPDIYGSEAEDLEAEEEDEGFDLVSRAEAALALPDEHFLEKVAKEAPTKKEAEAAASLE
ncbi:hypothetical protein JCM10213_003362 [Rhodosporidiobolus nylandii]